MNMLSRQFNWSTMRQFIPWFMCMFTYRDNTLLNKDGNNFRIKGNGVQIIVYGLTIKLYSDNCTLCGKLGRENYLNR